MKGSSLEPTKRFSNRVGNYLRYRPRYPRQIIPLLSETIGLEPSHVVADLGSGTGFLAELFLANGNPVYGVEPNREMREAGDSYLNARNGFTPVNGTAESTGLDDASIDAAVAGQAFHWFDPPATARELRRILRGPGRVALIWNDRKVDASPFLVEYEALLRKYVTDYDRVVHRTLSADEPAIAGFFGSGGYALTVIQDHEQVFDFEGLQGRLLSSSYAPVAGEPHHDPMMAELRRIFNEHQSNGEVRFLYDTKVYHGFLKPSR